MLSSLCGSSFFVYSSNKTAQLPRGSCAQYDPLRGFLLNNVFFQHKGDIEATISPHFSLVNADLRSTAAPRGFSLLVSSWLVAPFYSWEKEKSSRFKIEMAAPGRWCLCCVVVTQQFLFWRRMADYYGSFSKSFGYYKTSRVN